MTKRIRILAALIVAAFTVGPVSAATVTNAAPLAVSQATTVGTVSGTLRDNTGAPIAGATIILSGPHTYTATSDAHGAFTISGVEAGMYTIISAKPGYNTARESDLAVFAGETQNVSIVMGAASFSSLQNIATVVATGQATFNTSTASVNAVSAQDFADQGEIQVNRLLNQIPGVQASFSGASANAASPGSITYPTIRGALGYETASLIDGHPLAVGDYGDYVTSFLNSFMLQGAEVVKGPGAMSPETNYAIGGTINFRTKDPTENPTPEFTVGADNHGGTFSNFGYSDTVGRLGFVVDVATDNTSSALNNEQVWFNPAQNGVYGQSLSTVDSKSYVSGTSSYLTNVYGLVACCYTVTGFFNNTSELFKGVYKLSSATKFTASFLGSQTYSDQSGNTGSSTPTLFSPPAGYSGPLAANSQILLSGQYPGGENTETNNEPIFQAEMSSTLKNDTFLARYYHANIERIGNEGPGTLNGHLPMTINLYGGTDPETGLPFDGQSATVQYYDFYNQNEIDNLYGYSFEWDHPMGSSNDLTATWNYTNTKSQAYYYESNADYEVAVPAPNPTTAPYYSITIPSGSGQVFNTYMLRDHESFNDKLDGVLSLYENTYDTTYPYAAETGYSVNGTPPNEALPNGTGYLFDTHKSTHFDERAGLTYRPSVDLIVRAAAGSSIAPPYLSLLSTLNGTQSYSTTTNIVSQTVNSGTLLPETAFGYDLGADLRLKDHVTFLSTDFYLTNLYNHFISQTYNSGLTCGSTGVTCPSNAVPGAPIYYTSNVNLNNARFEGVELQIRRTPAYGFGYNASGALQRGFAYNLPPCFYSATPGDCSAKNTNLGIIAGENFTAAGLGAPSGYGFGAFQSSGSTSIPYFQANLDVSWRSPHGVFAELGDTIYGKNNSLNEPAFGIGYATLRVPINDRFAFQVSGDNIFNAYTGLFPIYGGGVPTPLAASPVVSGVTLPAQAATTGNVLGPATIRFEITTYFGPGPGEGNGQNRHSSR